MALSMTVNQARIWICILAWDYPYWNLHCKVLDMVLTCVSYHPKFQTQPEGWHELRTCLTAGQM